MSDNNCLIISHNSRIRCLITTLFNLEGTTLTDSEANKEEIKEQILNTRFKNGCVLLIKLIEEDRAYKDDVSLFYEGTLDPAENKASKGYVYWSVSNFPNFTGTFLIQDDTAKFTACHLYVVRHGQASHNLSGLMAHTKKDTSLTEEGKRQAQNTGEALKEIPFNHFFASDLVRTRETGSMILSTIENIKYPLDLIILPCAHEVPYSKDGNCDGLKNFALENQMNCSLVNINDESNTNCHSFLIDNDPEKKGCFKLEFI